MSLTEQILSQLPGNPLDGLRKADSLWQAIKEDTLPIPMVVKKSQDPLTTVEWDVVICGGTLGILIGTALANLGWRVALIERGILRGREQEWNISRQELEVFIELNLLSEAELEKAIATQYNPARVSFLGGSEVWVRDVLNIGIDPVFLLGTLKSKFLAAGGKLFENTPFSGAVVHPDGVILEAAGGLKTRLLIDAMGNFSPIVQQVRQGEKPDGVCLVVGSCAKGYPHNETGDLIASFTPIQNQCQYFWEAFPARDGRTTYLFTYLDADNSRPSLEFFFEEYLRLLPEYQSVELSQLQFERVLFGFFPSYRKNPIRMPWNRILPVGDSSGNQSPVSFGGFGAMVRHLKRLTEGIHEALQTDALSQNALALLQPYQPNIAVTWLFQRTMGVGVDQKVDPNQINQLLSGVFQAMEQLGDDVLRPFLQDVVQFPALTKTLIKTLFTKPGIVLQIIPQVGLVMLLDWMVHYINLGAYTALDRLGTALEPFRKKLPPLGRYYCDRFVQAWQYGSGSDYRK
ncbi:FAD-dependent oxidoreductase [Funiculus sociatus]|uniref:FAD-dependent oxidoreductase n=1 Tax=Funiculus sociatus TaxID=450527 RepID=UPI003298B1F8